MNQQDSPFREYHRARDRRLGGRVLLAFGVCAAVVVGSIFAGAAAPHRHGLADARPIVIEVPTEQPAVVLPAPAPAAPEPAPPPAPLAATGPTDWSITIDTTGYQAEIDQCLWVRMDLGAAAPIVGAHNYCGGGEVLDMALGDTVELTGTGLDGHYVVSDSRDAHSGDVASTATAGMAATVILQTCYWANDGTERLVALSRVG